MAKPKLPRKMDDLRELPWKVMTFQTITIATLVSQVAVFLLSTKVSFFPSEDSLKSILSTYSQIIAGLYGITLAGYTFFLSRIDGLMASDVTLDYVVIGIKKRFKYLIWHITFNMLMTLFTSAMLMYFPVPTEGDIRFFYRLFCNEFVLFLGFAVVLILYYSILVIDPNCMEKEARKQKKKLSRETGKQGSVAGYIMLYGKIQDKCNAMLPETVLDQIHENKGKRFEYSIGLLRQLHPELEAVFPDLIRVHHYYECMLNCSPMTVTQEMCQMAKKVLDDLEEKRPEMP